MDRLKEMRDKVVQLMKEYEDELKSGNVDAMCDIIFNMYHGFGSSCEKELDTIFTSIGWINMNNDGATVFDNIHRYVELIG